MSISPLAGLAGLHTHPAARRALGTELFYGRTTANEIEETAILVNNCEGGSSWLTV